tara:strand:- start:973 stop:1215 length:243 start_codon:yes stop_codon:yes gene_type:complete
MNQNLETKNNSDHFIDLANKRVPKALKYLDLVGNLANRSNYSYSEEQAKLIKKALKDKVNEICKKFDQEQTNNNYFKLMK